jgi:hypothetical protein
LHGRSTFILQFPRDEEEEEEEEEGVRVQFSACRKRKEEWHTVAKGLLYR